MNGFKYKWIIYFISSVILITLCIQVYWNYKNYVTGKQQLINDVQTSLDNSVDTYYTSLAQQHTFGFISDSIVTDEIFMDLRINDSTQSKDSSNRNFRKIIIRDTSHVKRFAVSSEKKKDSLRIEIHDSFPRSAEARFVSEGTIDPKVMEVLTSKVLFSFRQDTLSLAKIDSLIQVELERKNISMDYGLVFSGTSFEEQNLRSGLIKTATLETSSKSPYFIDGRSLTIYFSNITLSILKKNSLGILLSFLLVASVIFCLLYLLKIITRQKQLAEVKNDLISNITHEFKTPIATIGAAMEGIRTFNPDNNSEKNLRYAQISSEQVEKLNGMVEKLLETATLDSDTLSLHFERTNLVEMLRKAATKEAFASGDKSISFKASAEDIYYAVDVFHFENAVNNIIDNAIKYGGDRISVAINRRASQVEISISDNGKSLSEEHKKHIFEKFYRVPKGNTHDVKGFGIGLYYSKKIVEKHQGTVTLHLNKLTEFKILLPHVIPN
jgi:two-component system phosphate regulon sensor histidine kinase PhoR